MALSFQEPSEAAFETARARLPRELTPEERRRFYLAVE